MVFRIHAEADFMGPRHQHNLEDVLGDGSSVDVTVERIGRLKIDIQGRESQEFYGAENCLRLTERVALQVKRDEAPSVEEWLA